MNFDSSFDESGDKVNHAKHCLAIIALESESKKNTWSIHLANRCVMDHFCLLYIDFERTCRLAMLEKGARVKRKAIRHRAPR